MQQKVKADKTTMEAPPQWAAGLHAMTDRIGPRVLRTEPRQRAAASIQGLLSPLARQNGGHLAEHAGDEASSGVPHLLGRAGRRMKYAMTCVPTLLSIAALPRPFLWWMKQAFSRRAGKVWGGTPV